MRKLEIKYKKPNAPKTQQIFLSAEIECARSYACKDGLQQGSPNGPKERKAKRLAYKPLTRLRRRTFDCSLSRNEARVARSAV
jgi:hypothetical protein